MTIRAATQYNDARNQLHDVDSAAAYPRCGPRLIYRRRLRRASQGT